MSVFHETVPQLSSIAIQPLPPELARWQSKHFSLQSQLLKLLSAFDLYERLIENYYQRGLFTIIPAPLILNALRFARKYLENNEDTTNPKQRNLYRKICQNTAKPLQISATATAEEFYQSFTGENLRWEFVGVIFALAGLSVINITHDSEDLALRFGDGEALSVESFSAQMVAASNEAIEMSRQHDKVNDIMIWLEYTHCVLISMVLDETCTVPVTVFLDFEVLTIM